LRAPTHPFFTIGHSTRTIPDFARLLTPNEVSLVVDVRKVPRSRFNPQFNAEAMPAALAPFGIGYEHMPALGGLRGRVREVPVETNAYWENASFHNYADYAMTPAFREAFEALLARGRDRRCAIMCAESVWWQCHRRIITDYLLASGVDVFHLIESDVPEPARLTAEARAVPNGLAYPGPNLQLPFEDGGR
jgi:uncharacterized protein (DUF488 family)